MANEKIHCNTICDWNDPSDGCVKPRGGFCPMSNAVSVEIETPCLICGEGVPVSGYNYSPKICEKCKAAVMKVREQDGK